MENIFTGTLGFLSQFTGGQGGIDYAVHYGIAALLWALLLILALEQRRFSPGERERLLVIGFSVGLARELFMVFMAYLQALGAVRPESLHVVFPPLEHALSDWATITVAAAFLLYVLQDRELAYGYLKAAFAAVAACYLATFWWWAKFISAHPDAKFGSTWCEWLFRINAGNWLAIAVVIIAWRGKGWLRNAVSLALFFFFLAEALKIADIALAEVYEYLFTPVRRGFYLMAIPLLGYVYIRELTFERWQSKQFLQEAREKLEQRVVERTAELAEVNQALHREIVAHKNAEENAAAANQAKSRFLASMSHEIRTPMNAILGLSNLALKQEMAPKLRKYISVIKESGQTLLEVINDILDFSKIEAGKLELEHIDFYVSDILDSIADIFSGKIAEKKEVEMVLSIDEDVPKAVIGDPLRLKQVLINLVNNAIKFTKEGSIAISVRLVQHRGQQVVLRFMVQDTGTGINHEQIRLIFDPFSQADPSTTREYGGTGLGLTISKRLVELMGGVIEADSVPGKGSSFYFTVQLETKTQENLEAAGNNLYLGIKVLVVDDSDAIRETLSLVLEKNLCCDVTCAASGEEALQMLEKDRQLGAELDLIITDLIMPGMDGIQFAEAARTTSELANTPVLLISGLGNDAILERSGTSRVDAFLSKPIKVSELYKIALALTSGHKIPGEIGQYGRDVIDSLRQAYFAGRTVLLVEDNVINQQIAQELLASAGIAVEIAKNGREATEAVRRKRYDALLMDIQMPVMDGFDATREIRRDPANDAVPIIAMTAHAIKGYQEQCLAVGMNDYLSKPMEEEVLFATLKKWLPPVDGKADLRSTGGAGSPSEASVLEHSLPASLPGLNIRAGLELVMGRQELYLKFLAGFVRDHADTVMQLTGLLAKDDVDSAAILIHSVKGLAANLGADRLRNIAEQIERSLRLGNLDSSDALVKHLQTAISEVVKSAASLLAARH